MPITQMQHYMVLAKDLEKTRAFYCDVLGLRVGPRPPFDFEGLWIYVGDVAVVHVAGQASYERTGRTEANGRRHGRGDRPHRRGIAHRSQHGPGAARRHLRVARRSGG